MKKKKTMPAKSVLIVVIAVFALIIVSSFAMYLLQTQNQNSSEENHIYSGEVAEIIDGDTFKMQNGEIVRLICVDTPEEGKEGYDDAINFLQSKILYADNIRLEGNSSDKYNRSLRWAYVNDVLVNKEIVEYGFGSIFEYEDENCSLMN